MTNENLLSGNKCFSIRLTKALKKYNDTFCSLISMLNNSTSKPRSHLIKHIQKRMVQYLYIMKLQTLSMEMFKGKHIVCQKLLVINY